MEQPRNLVLERFCDRELMDKAMRQAFREAVMDHRQSGIPMSFWENGKMLIMSAHDVHLEGEPMPASSK